MTIVHIGESLNLTENMTRCRNQSTAVLRGSRIQVRGFARGSTNPRFVIRGASPTMPTPQD